MNLEAFRDEIKAITSDCKGTPTAKLIAVLEAAGITSTKEIAELLNLKPRAIQCARKSATQCASATECAQLNAPAQRSAPKAQPIAHQSATECASEPSRIHARLESPSGIDSNLEVLDSPSSVPPKAKSKRGARLPEQWTLPVEWQQWARINFAHASDAMVSLEADKFRDFWHAKPGQGACKLDWEATWRNWCRTAFAAVPSKQPINWGRSAWDEQRAAEFDAGAAAIERLRAKYASQPESVQ